MKYLIRKVYGLVPFKRQLFAVFRPFVKPREKVYKHLHFEGDFSINIDELHSFRMRHFGFELENTLFWAGLDAGWEKTSISLWKQLVRDAEVIIDVGANTGIYSLVAKSLNPKANVYAFEPIKRVFEKLEYNSHLNGFNIMCFESALSNSDGTALVYDTPTEHVYSVTVNKNLNEPNTEVVPTDIATVRLDTFIEQEQIKKIDLIKIDVETHEPEVLDGFGYYLEKFRPTILIEILNDEVGRRVEQFVQDLGYVYFNIDEKSGSVRRVDKITTSDFYNYLMCDENIARRLKLLARDEDRLPE